MVLTLEQLKEQMIDPEKWVRPLKANQDAGLVFVLLRGLNRRPKLASFFAYRENGQVLFDSDSSRVDSEVRRLHACSAALRR